MKSIEYLQLPDQLQKSEKVNESYLVYMRVKDNMA